MNKKKIINDPVYGFITIHNELIFDIIEHRYFQRLRRIRQLGISDFVYPGATHSRFHHALGAMDLMRRTLNILRSKGHEISDQEYEAAQIAILLHDIGHGPFSHSLEYNLLKISHEDLSLLLIQKMNEEFDGALNLAIDMFYGRYGRKFFHQLVASQLDIDRLDYLKRDSFFTGVQEGTIGSERIIKMLNIVDEELVVEEKGIYSIENFLSARRLMYWQVYLHKAAVSAEVMLTQLIKRGKKLKDASIPLDCTPPLSTFLATEISISDFEKNPDLLEHFASLDDMDIWGSMKFWVNHKDSILSYLSKSLLERKLFKIELSNSVFAKEELSRHRALAAQEFNVNKEESKFLVKKGTVSNSAYVTQNETINILTKSGEVKDVALATDLPNIKAMTKIVKKHYLCYPKKLSLQFAN